MRYSLLLVAVLQLLALAPAGLAGEGVFVLRREAYRDGGFVQGRLVRELSRQALLLAARDELGYATRDETLGETSHLEKTAVALDWLPRVRTQWRGPTEIRLSDSGVATQPQAEGGQSDKAPDLEAITIEHGKLKKQTIYPLLAIALEKASREQLPERLREAGLAGETPAFNPDNQPGETVETLLQQMDFVSQWDAVARAHRAIAAEGPSVGWLSVLSRGYVHLGSLIDHHWCGAPEAFFARGLLYAERARSLGGVDTPEAAWLRPYALSICGAQAASLLETYALQRAKVEMPAWAELIDPINRFQLEKLVEIGESESEFSALACWQVVALRRTLGSQRSFHEVAQRCLKKSPDAYGVYNYLVRVYPSLGDQRFGANVGPNALGRFPLLRLAGAADLPKKLRGSLPADEEALQVFLEELQASEGEGPLPPFTSAPNFVAKMLRSLDDRSDQPTEPSWGVLATMIEEEQFVMAANYCKSLVNATETSLVEPIESLELVVKEHRFAGYISSYHQGSNAPGEALVETLGSLEFTEPRHNMWPMLSRAMRLPPDEEDRMTAGHHASWDAMWSADYRLGSMAEEYEEGGGYWWSRLDRSRRKSIKNNYYYVASEAPLWLRHEMYSTTNPKPEKLAEWAEKAGRDSRTASLLADYYTKAEDDEQALAWTQKAYDLEPGPDTVIKLAKLHRRNGDEELWLSTLEKYLNEHESRGLGHSNVNRYIAKTYIRERDYESAMPYAAIAAECYSASTLATAQKAAEGLAAWEEADHYAHALSSSYPSHNGASWYFFRQRTGHGDPEETLPLLAFDFQSDENNTHVWDKLTFPYMEGDIETAIDLLQAKADQKSDPAYCYMMAVIMALEIGDQQRLQSAVTPMREFSKTELKQNKPAMHKNTMRCLSLIESKELKIQRDRLLEGIDFLGARDRRNYQLFFGATLLHLGIEEELAIELLEAAVSTPRFHNMSGNIAGRLLVKKRGFARDEPITPLADEESEEE